MIKINLLAEKKPAKTKAPTSLKFEGVGGGQNFLLAGILVLGFLVAAGWSWARTTELKRMELRKTQAEAELVRLQEVRKKAEEFKRQKDLLEKKITLITDLKKKQAVPVHLLDQVSRNLPDFLWLDAMSAAANQVNVSGKATTYTAVSNFYDNLLASGYFTDVVLGKTSEVPEGVAFSLVCKFAPPAGVTQMDLQAPPAEAPKGG
jgi:Tfp pilus assembly protein PilN